MTISQRLHAQVALVALLVVGLAATGWIIAPAKAAFWMLAVGTMAGIWLVVAVIGRVRPFADQSAAERGLLTASVIAAGLILAVSLGKAIAALLGFDGGELIDRALGVGTGAVLLVIGNTIPKVLRPLTAKRCSPTQVQSIQRFAGWVFALAGLVSIAAWLFRPVAQAPDWMMYAVLSAIVLVALRHAWAFIAPATTRSPPIRD
jgi:hypothetical protein